MLQQLRLWDCARARQVLYNESVARGNSDQRQLRQLVRESRELRNQIELMESSSNTSFRPCRGLVHGLFAEGSICRPLPDDVCNAHGLDFIERVDLWVGQNWVELVDNFKYTVASSSQFTIGNWSGYLSGLFFQKFGLITILSTGAAFWITNWLYQRKFIRINWQRVLDTIDMNPGPDYNIEEDDFEPGSPMLAMVDTKVRAGVDFITNHRHLCAGFFIGFVNRTCFRRR